MPEPIYYSSWTYKSDPNTQVYAYWGAVVVKDGVTKIEMPKGYGQGPITNPYEYLARSKSLGFSSTNSAPVKVDGLSSPTKINARAILAD